MATCNKPPSGELLLMDYFNEYSTGHYDPSRTLRLCVGKVDNIEIVGAEDECNQLKGLSSFSKTTWNVDSDALIEFIKNKGQWGPVT